jgi:hypothetical protein
MSPRRASFFFALLVALLLPMSSRAVAQTAVPTAGTHFTFGIIEGPDAAVTPGELTSELYLTVLSPFSGCGLIVSPSGYSQQFSFDANKPMRVGLDYSLMQTNDLGKSKKGLLLQTSQPVNAYIHDWTQSGGDATQIYPDEALDTSFVVGGWGLFNDPGEQNHACVLVAAASDATDVTIVPAVSGLGGVIARQPIQITLDRGETYIVKADIFDMPSTTSLSGTTVVSSKPVAVFSGVTCAYVPLGRESCNEMLDEALGKKWWSKHYFAQPLGNGDSTARLILTSDRDFFASMNGAAVFSSNGRIETSFDKPVEIASNVPIQVQQIVGGSEVSGAGVGDPSLVSIFPVDHYADTLFWSIPNLGMSNFAPIIIPTSDISQTTLDGQPLSSFGPGTPINGSPYSALRLSVYPGAHRLNSPNGVFTLGVGFDIFDAFSYVAGSVLPERPRDTVKHSIVLQIDSASTCDTFAVAFSFDSAVTEESGVTDLHLILQYDPNLMLLVSLTPGSAVTGSPFVVDSSIPGIIRVQVIGKPLVIGKDLFRIVFFGKASGNASFTNAITVGACGEDQQLFIGGVTPFDIRGAESAMPRTFAVPDSELQGLVTCEPYLLSIVSDTLLTANDHFVPLRIEYIYPSTDEQVISGTLTDLLQSRYRSIDNRPGHFSIDLMSGSAVSGGDTLLRLLIQPTAVGMHNIRVIVTFLLCGDTVFKEFDLHYPVALNIDSEHVRLSITTSPVTWGNESSANIALSGLPIDAHVKDFTLDVAYDHDVLSFFKWENGGTLTNGWQIVGPTQQANGYERFSFTSSAAELGTSGPLIHLLFRTYVSDSTSTPILVTSSLESKASCPLEYQTGKATITYAGRDLCGDSIVRSYMRKQPIEITYIRASASYWDIGVASAYSGPVELRLFDVLGQTLDAESISVNAGQTTVELAMPERSGSYVLRVSGFGFVRSRIIQVSH